MILFSIRAQINQGRKSILKWMRRFVAILLQRYSHSTVHRSNIAICVSLVAAMLFAFQCAGLLSDSGSPIQPGEIDLSGEWKISFQDQARSIKANTDGTHWCPIGVPDPALFNGAKPDNCPREAYPVNHMRGATYWYQKKITILENQKWNEPALFLGAIKHKAAIYWDGKLVALTDHRVGTGLISILLDQPLVAQGQHTLSIKVTSFNTRFPGIFHAYPRKVTLGEYSATASQHSRIVTEKYIFPSVNIFVQTSGLLLTMLLIILGKGTTQSLFWLSIYFFGSTVGNLAHLAPTELHQAFLRVGMYTTSFAFLGYGLKFHDWPSKVTAALSRCIFALLVLSLFFYFMLLRNEASLGNSGSTLTAAIAIFPLVFFLYGAATRVWRLLAYGEAASLSTDKIASICILGFLHFLTVANELFLANMPLIFDHPAVKSTLSLALVAAMIYQFTEQERTLAFFGRFIRPGLKSLLDEQARNGKFDDLKLFRPRKIAIMKVDIVGHTETTYQMPYGMKRLFQDTWFTVIDQVVSDRVFLDKNVGDGSIYCFSETHEDGACVSALKSAERIVAEAINAFDQELNSRLAMLLNATEEIRGPSESFFAAYKARTGVQFDVRQTKVRIALVYGFVDEGLWGLTSQSHYDVQGDLVSLAARIEGKARENEILLSSEFEAEIRETEYAKKLSPRSEFLKGMGQMTVFSYFYSKNRTKMAS